MIDAAQRQSWQEFHCDHARLRLLSPIGNLSQAKIEVNQKMTNHAEPKYQHHPTQGDKDIAEGVSESIAQCEDSEDSLAEKFMVEYVKEKTPSLTEEGRARALPPRFARQKCPGCHKPGFIGFCSDVCRMVSR
jgi:hypothetical protein